MLDAVLFAAGLFWFGGGSGMGESAVIGIVGAGFNLIFQNAVNYRIDAFTIYAASPQAANMFLGSLVCHSDSNFLFLSTEPYVVADLSYS
jgi:DHA1 family multidrug resistance protein-like MFS transporter